MNKDLKIKELEKQLDELKKDNRIKELEAEISRLKNGGPTIIYPTAPNNRPSVTPNYPYVTFC